MSKRAHPDGDDVVARARAAIAEKYAKLNTDHKSPKAAKPETKLSAINPELQRRIDDAKARAAARSKPEPPRPVERSEARGGLAVRLHPALADDALLLPSKRSSTKSKFATTIANKKEESTHVPKSKQLELLNGPGDDFTDREKNPYFDHKLGGRDTTRPTDRRSRPITFNEPGKFIEKANQIRNEQHLKELKARIEATARRAGLEDDLDVTRAIAVEEPPEVEWWDQEYTTNGTYEDVDTNQLKIDSADSPVTAMIQHPIPLPSPADTTAPGPAAIMYTKREQKKIRKQDREAKLKDKQDKQRLGLIPPDPPKVKLSNMATVLAQSTVQDPTAVEQQVRAQVKARLTKHEQTNAERALTSEEKQEKATRKLREDESRGIHAAAWSVTSMENGYNRRRIDLNAQQCGVTGFVILHERVNLVYIEAGRKSVAFFKKLMDRRIEWGDTQCVSLWEGEIKSRTFGAFRYFKCVSDDAVKDVLGPRVHALSLWNIAKHKE